MGPEHMGRETTLVREPLPMEERIPKEMRYSDFGRPSGSELPYIGEYEKTGPRDLESFGRNRTELPHIGEYEKSGPQYSENFRRNQEEIPRLDIPDVAYARPEGDQAVSGAERDSDHAREQREGENGYYSTYKERVDQTPREDSGKGQWSGERGESEFIPADQEIKDILGKYGKEGIAYKDGIPDFSDVSESTVEIGRMTENRPDNFRQCDETCAEQWNKEERDGRTDWTARDVKEWRQENNYTWHERNDMKTCDLVPTKINDYFGHLGGVSECKKRDAESGTGGDEFDE